MNDSSLPAESLVLARCTECSATFKVRHADRTYRCKHCGGEVRSDGESDVDELFAAPAPAKSTAQKRARERHAHDLPSDREERKQLARDRQRVEKARSLIGLVLWVEVAFLGWLTIALVPHFLKWIEKGFMPVTLRPTDIVFDAVMVAVALPLVLVMQRRLRDAPTRIALTLAMFLTMAAVPVLVVLPNIYELVSVAGFGSIGIVLPLLFQLGFVAFHWYAYVALRRFRKADDEVFESDD